MGRQDKRKTKDNRLVVMQQTEQNYAGNLVNLTIWSLFPERVMTECSALSNGQTSSTMCLPLQTHTLLKHTIPKILHCTPLTVSDSIWSVSTKTTTTTKRSKEIYRFFNSCFLHLYPNQYPQCKSIHVTNSGVKCQ